MFGCLIVVRFVGALGMIAFVGLFGCVYMLSEFVLGLCSRGFGF